MVAQPQKYLTLEEYAALEEAAGVKHEYYRGAAYAMTGASPRHNVIVANTIAALHPQLRGTPRTVYPSDLRVKVEQTGLYTYPDVSVICGELMLDPARRDTATNPVVLIEVLSPSTRDYDRGTKFQHYRTIDTLQEYIVIAQDAVHIEQYVRQTTGRWLLTECGQKDQSIHIAAIGCELRLGDVYERVAFPDGGLEAGAGLHL